MQIDQNRLSLDDVTISIIGGTGGMGKLFARVFRKYLKVVICSRNFYKAKKTAIRLKVSAWPLEECNKADIVLVSIPIEETYKVCKEVSKKMKKDSLLIEISSVKSGIADRLSKDLNEKKIKYLSLHPLFGPRIRNLNEKRIVIIRSKSNLLMEKIIKILNLEKAKIIKSTIEEHDKLMALVQVTHHFMHLGFLTMERYYDINLIKKFQTESFKRTVKNLEMIRENRDTILTIQRMNPFSQEAKSRYIEVLNKLKKMDSNSINLIYESIDSWF